jgi:hypothetical protein
MNEEIKQQAQGMKRVQIVLLDSWFVFHVDGCCILNDMGAFHFKSTAAAFHTLQRFMKPFWMCSLRRAKVT